MKTAHPKYKREAKLRPLHSTCAEPAETIELRVNLDKKLYDALSWYAKQTGNLLGDSGLDEFINEWMTDSISSYLERARDLSYYHGFP